MNCPLPANMWCRKSLPLQSVNSVNLSNIYSRNVWNQWGKFKGEKGKNVYEIDIVALNENTKDILFCECKWKNKKTDVGVLEDLQKKSQFVDWYNDERNEYFAVISKSGFTHIAEKFAKQNGFLLFELNDFDNIT